MSLNYDTIKHMNLFTPNALANEYIEQYAYCLLYTSDAADE